MKRLTVVAAILITACGTSPVTPVEAGLNKTKVTVITDWSQDDEGSRVVTVDVQGRTVVCVQVKDKFGSGYADSGSPKGVSVAVSCDWAPK